MFDFEKRLSDLSKQAILCIGDVMLDTYMWGSVERISPEAPVPVVALNKREYRIGGAGNVALKIASLGGRMGSGAFLSLASAFLQRIRQLSCPFD